MIMKFRNPIAFTQGPVAIITTAIYVAVIATLIAVQNTVPRAPTSSPQGVNLTEAWNDLQVLSAAYHPFNSRRNDFIHDWLVSRIKSIVQENNRDSSQVIIFSDTVSNATFSSSGNAGASNGISVYFEGLNIIVYVPGIQDEQKQWWHEPRGRPPARNGVLVNAHYDSVSTGYGATDDGMGVVSVLQLLRYYTTEGHAPKHGLVLLLNNGEEDFLNGARVFGQHPMSKLVGTFLNLEGAGAGGRATLFRSTDVQVTKAYGRSPYPFGTVVSGDGFNRGLIRSQTDYVVFNGILGLRGLDVAFTEPRARYHTDQDDARHTSEDSLWHMLSAALATTKQLTSEGMTSKLNIDDSTRAVWFDMFGRVFAVFRMHTLFALSVTLLVVAPVFLALTLILLHRLDKLYLFCGHKLYHTRDGDEKEKLHGWHGFLRFPLVLALACAAPTALAYLIATQNPFIVHSSEWAVWSMMVSSFVLVAWLLCRIAHQVRPSALTRAYGYAWLFAAWWVFLVIALVLQTESHLAGDYLVLFYTATLFTATWLAHLELFSLPTKTQYCLDKYDNAVEGIEPAVHTHPSEEEQEDPTEETGLLAGIRRSAFKNYARQPEDTGSSSAENNPRQPTEQEWSKSLWSWIWILQILVFLPINLIFLGQVALLTVGGLHQTGADGSSMFTVYVIMALFAIIMFSPVVPIVHRITWHLPTFLLLVLVGTITYNLVAFPFSSTNRVKLFFQQEIDFDHGNNSVSLIGVAPYIVDAINAIPSAAGQEVRCENVGSDPVGSHREKCSWPGIPPAVVSSATAQSVKSRYGSWVNFNVSRHDTRTARFMLSGRNTRACKLQFTTPISDFYVRGQGPVEPRFPPVPVDGSKEIRLWSRTWDRVWTVDVTWARDENDSNGAQKTGRVVCLWSDDNHDGVIPALDEIRKFAPNWVAVSKAGDGLVEGYKRFAV